MKVVMFTFESFYVKKVGGLAEVPPRLGEAMSKRGIGVELYTPSHGVLDACKEPVFSTVVQGVKHCISVFPGAKPTHYVVGGGLLDEMAVYPPGRLMDKALTFARVIAEYFSRVLAGSQGFTVFHGHDWHSVPALLAVNSLSTRFEVPVKLVYHVHLYSKNTIELEGLCRVVGLCWNTPIRGDHGLRDLGYYVERSHGLIERLAALVVDKVITVSKGYSKSLLRVLGLNSAHKLDYVYNASPLTWSEVKSILVKSGVKTPEDHGERLSFRRSLLTKDLSYVKLEWQDENTEKRVKNLLEYYGVSQSTPFKSDGPLVFSIGRLSKQKGFDVVLKALDKLTINNPRLKVVMALSPSMWDVDAMKVFIEAQLSYPDNLRVLLGMVSREDAVKLYYAANATLVPSRSEPFGLVALESMACGTPVSASRVGGLVDIVTDVRKHGVNGVGVLFTPSDVKDLVESTSYLVELVESTYLGAEEPRTIRDSCIKRSEEFNWGNSAEKMINIYSRLLTSNLKP